MSSMPEAVRSLKKLPKRRESDQTCFVMSEHFKSCSVARNLLQDMVGITKRMDTHAGEQCLDAKTLLQAQ